MKQNTSNVSSAVLKIKFILGLFEHKFNHWARQNEYRRNLINKILKLLTSLRLDCGRQWHFGVESRNRIDLIDIMESTTARKEAATTTRSWINICYHCQSHCVSQFDWTNVVIWDDTLSWDEWLNYFPRRTKPRFISVDWINDNFEDRLLVRHWLMIVQSVHSSNK